jgi:hypothetical protein
MRRTLAAVIICCLLATSSRAAPAAPTAVSLRWATETTAVISWVQASDANWVCINGWDEYNIGIFRQCEATVAGPHTMTLTPERVTGLQYYDIVEWTGPAEGRSLSGQYQAYLLYRERVLLPFLQR